MSAVDYYSAYDIVVFPLGALFKKISKSHSGSPHSFVNGDQLKVLKLA